MTITVVVENDTIKLPVHVPDGTRLEITLPDEGVAPTPRRSAGGAVCEIRGPRR